MKKIMSIMLIVVITMMLFVGCKKADVPEKTVDNGNNTVDKVEDTKPIKLRWFNFQPELTELTSNLAEAYNKQYPNVTVEVEIVGDGYWDVLKARAASGDMPDIFTTRGYRGMELYTSYMADLSKEPFVEKMVDGIMLGLSSDGKILGMPYQMSGWGVIYNKKIFRDNNLEIPTTLSELEQVSNTLKENGITPFINQFKDTWLLGQISGTGIANIPKPNTFITSVEEGTGDFADSTEMQKHLEFLDFVLENGQEKPLDDDWNSSCAKMGQGKAAMMLEGVWVYDTIAAVNPEIELGMFPVPYTNNAEDSSIYADFNGLWHISKDTEHPEAAKQFLNWLAENETSKNLMKEAGLIPAYKGYEANTNSIGMDIMKYIEKEKINPFGWLLAPDGFEGEAGRIYQEYIINKPEHKQVLQSLSKLVKDLTMN